MLNIQILLKRYIGWFFLTLTIMLQFSLAYAQDTSKQATDVNDNKKIIVAIIDDKPIFRNEYLSFLATLPQEVQAQANTEEAYKQLLTHLVQMRVLSNKARELGIDADPQVVSLVRAYEERTLVDIYLRAQVGAQLNEKAIRKIYNEMIKQQSSQEEMQASHILVDTLEQATELVDQLNKGSDFADLARQHSKGPSGANGGDLGYFSTGQMVPAFEESAFKLSEGEYTKNPVKTQFGWHIILAGNKRLQTLPSFEQARVQIEEQESNRLADDVVQKHLSTVKIEMFDIEGKSSN